MKDNTQKLPISKFQIHPEVHKTYRAKDLDCLRFTIHKFGQQNPIVVIERSGQMYIIDGVSRFHIATQLQLPLLIYVVAEVEDEKIMEYRMLKNMKTKRGMIEMCLEVEYILDTLGSSQGKKRDLMGFDDFFKDSNHGKVGKDRYELACALLGIEMKSSTLRKLMKVFWSECSPSGKSSVGILEQLDEGHISVDTAYKLLCDKERKMKQNADTKSASLYIAHSDFSESEKRYQLFNKSCLKMEEVSNDSIALVIDSHPYWKQRAYRNQNEMLHGQEPTLEEYLRNFRAFSEEKYRKLKPGGVLATVIGESYNGGYQGVCTAVETVIEEIGFKIIDVVIWVKSNQKYAPHPNRFQNSYERIILAYKPGSTPNFKEVYRKGSVDNYKVKKTSSGSLYIASPETCITNVIFTPTFNQSDLRKIDPEFRHDAPCPQEIYRILIEAYSNPGDMVLDGFVGSGTVGEALKLGRTVIGYDVDPLSIEFSKKRFDLILQEEKKDTQLVAA